MCDDRRSRGRRRQGERREGEQGHAGRNELLAHGILPFLDAQLGWALIELSGRLPARRAPRGLIVLPPAWTGCRGTFYQGPPTGQAVVTMARGSVRIRQGSLSGELSTLPCKSSAGAEGCG